MNLKEYRSSSRLTQKQLAKMIGVTELSVIKYEEGRTIPSKDVMLRIYEVTSGTVTPNDFYDLENIKLRNPGFEKAVDRNPELRVAVGLMSGTSMDGIDAAAIVSDGRGFVNALFNTSMTYDLQFKTLIKSAELALAESEGDLEVAAKDFESSVKKYLVERDNLNDIELSKAIKDLRIYLNGNDTSLEFQAVVTKSTALHAEIVERLLTENGYRSYQVDVIGYHGQSLFHRPAKGITIQVGDGEYLANATDLPVVYDFRTNDVKNGGQGAPFAPLYHRALAVQAGLCPLVIANCGGIANITVIPESENDIFAYDTGPGNALIDRYVAQKVGKSMDEDGIYGSAGQVNESVLELLRQKSVLLYDGRNYLDMQPPKSLDPHDMCLIPELDDLSLQDACATLEAFTAWCIVDSLRWVTKRKIEVPKLWVLAGGGWKNPVIVFELEKRLKAGVSSEVKVCHADEVGWSSQAMEAQIFAYLAIRSQKNLPLSVPGTTGVPEPMVGGRLALPSKVRSKKN